MTSRDTMLSRAGRLRQMLDACTVAIPGAYNALTAMQIERAGYEAVYVSGAAVSACRGMPDIGRLSLSQMLGDAATIAKAVSIPTIVDADTGYGPPNTVREAVRAFEDAGLAGMQIEDQEGAKKCGHLSGKRVIPARDMVEKIEAATESRARREFVIVARTDARGAEGLDSAVGRALVYAKAGADALFPEALESAEEFRRFSAAMQEHGVTIPLIANMTEFGKTPYLTVQQFGELGYRGVLFPVTALRIATRAIEKLLVELRRCGSQQDWLDRMMTRAELYDLLRYEQETKGESEVP
ncbi:methylisocitrate lyase [Nitrospira sp.]|nr:methylisocitrate lyase [Nitrospira sp.]